MLTVIFSGLTVIFSGDCVNYQPFYNMNKHYVLDMMKISRFIYV